MTGLKRGLPHVGLGIAWLGLGTARTRLACVWPGLGIWRGLAWGCRGLGMSGLAWVWRGLAWVWRGLAWVWCGLAGYGVTWLGTHAGHEQSQNFALRAKF